MTKSQKITYAAILTALNVVLNVATLPKIEGLGTVSFVYSICYLSGIIMGPWYGLLIGALGDLLGFLIRPTGPFNIIITLSNALIPFVIGMCYRYIKVNKYIRIIIGVVLSFMISTLIITPWGLVSIGYFGGYFKKAFKFQLTFQPIWVLINTTLTFLIYTALSRMKSNTALQEVL